MSAYYYADLALRNLHEMRISEEKISKENSFLTAKINIKVAPEFMFSHCEIINIMKIFPMHPKIEINIAIISIRKMMKNMSGYNSNHSRLEWM